MVPFSDSRLSLIARHGVVQILKHAMAQLQQRLAGRRDPDAPADAMKDRLAELVLEQQDLTADGGLGDVQLFARRGERAAVGDGADDFELTQVHAVSIHSVLAWVQGNPCAAALGRAGLSVRSGAGLKACGRQAGTGSVRTRESAEGDVVAGTSAPRAIV